MPFVHQLIDDLVAETVDIHRMPAREVQHGLFALRRASGVHASVSHFPVHVMNRAVALGTMLRHAKRLAVLSFFHDFQNVRNDFARALDQHGVADLQAQPLDLIHIVECGTADSDASHLHRLKHRDRRQRARAADLHDDVVDDGRLLPRWIFERNRPPRSFGGKPQFVLNGRGIDLDHDAIDLIRQLFALRVPVIAVSGHRLDPIAQLPIIRSTETQLLQCSEAVGMLRKRHFAIDEKVVREKIQPPRRSDRGIENAHGSGRGIARVHKNLSACQLLLPVQRLKRLARHQHFAAHLEIGGQSGLFQCRRIDLQRYRANRFYIGSDVFAGRSIAARHAAHKFSASVLQRNTQTIEFVLGNIFDLFLANAFTHAPVEVAQRVVRKRVVEAQHCPRMLHRLETFAGCAADANRRRFRRNQLRIRCFERLQFLHQLVVSRIRYFWFVEDVIAIFVVPKLLAKPFDLFLDTRRRGFGHETLSRRDSSISPDII